MKPALLLLLASAALPAIEISTGAILGRGLDARAFYQRGGPDGAWEKTYSAPEYRPEAQGKLMNIRLAEALFEDPGPEALDLYKRHGVLMIDVGLQGGSGGVYRPDGSLDPAGMARLDRLLNAAGQRAMVVDLIYFRAGPDGLFRSTKAIHAAARNVTDWLIARDFRNLIVDVADEFDQPADNWAFEGYISQNVISLIDEVRVRFRAARFQVPVGASSGGRMRYPESVAGQADVVMLHGNNRDPQQKAARAAEFHKFPRPVLMTGDDNGREGAGDDLKAERASCDVFFHQGAGWGYTLWSQPPASVHAVLDYIAGLVLRAPPE